MKFRKDKEVIQNYEKALARVILYGVQELPFSFGVKKVIRFLKGSKSSFVIDHELYRLNMYGILPAFTTKYLTSIIERLLEQELLVIAMASDDGNYPVLEVTQKGIRFLEGGDVPSIGFAHELSDKDIILLDNVELVLYEALRQLRMKFAAENELPAYTICHNRHLREMIRSKPNSEDELCSINGIGESFIRKYGSDFLSVIKTFENHKLDEKDKNPPNPASS